MTATLTVTDDPVTRDVARSIAAIRRRTVRARAWVAAWSPAPMPTVEPSTVGDLRKLVRS